MRRHHAKRSAFFFIGALVACDGAPARPTPLTPPAPSSAPPSTTAPPAPSSSVVSPTTDAGATPPDPCPPATDVDLAAYVKGTLDTCVWNVRAKPASGTDDLEVTLTPRNATVAPGAEIVFELRIVNVGAEALTIGFRPDALVPDVVDAKGSSIDSPPPPAMARRCMAVGPCSPRDATFTLAPRGVAHASIRWSARRRTTLDPGGCPCARLPTRPDAPLAPGSYALSVSSYALGAKATVVVAR